MAWFGIRGAGSIYYLMYAIHHGLAPNLAGRLTSLTFTLVAASIVMPGITVTALMNRYQQREPSAPSKTRPEAAAWWQNEEKP